VPERGAEIMSMTAQASVLTEIVLEVLTVQQNSVQSTSMRVYLYELYRRHGQRCPARYTGNLGQDL